MHEQIIATPLAGVKGVLPRSMVAASKIVRWMPVVTYAVAAWVFSVLFVLAYGAATGSL
ncbi:MAG: hypothetical protein QW587_02980 [Candidatus Bathyarchaeia archaeon]